MAFPGFVPAPLGPTAPASKGDYASAQWWRKAIDVANRNLNGKLNVSRKIGLNPLQTSTMIIDPRISATSGLLWSPLSAGAAAIEPSMYVSSQQAGQATLGHSPPADQFCVFTVVILG